MVLLVQTLIALENGHPEARMAAGAQSEILLQITVAFIHGQANHDFFLQLGEKSGFITLSYPPKEKMAPGGVLKLHLSPRIPLMSARVVHGVITTLHL